jgi:serine/threonine protein kinase
MTGCQACGASNIDTARFCAECGKPIEKPIETGLSALHTIDPVLAQQKPDGDGGKSLFDLKPGEIFADRYRIVEEIGRGGMGVVYRVHDPVTQRDVALKLIRGDRLAGKDAVKRLVREGVLARDIRHPNVVAVYDVGEVKGLPFLTMEMLSGGSLRAWMQKQMRQGEEASMATAANIIHEVLNGLDAAHAQGVIHRDLKPENIVLLGEPNDHEARLKILDFGIARAGGGSETGSTSLGTLEYMSPEQLTAPEAAQASADFYSLSVMFYELLIGVVPKGHWQPPSGGRSDVPPAIDKLIERGLSNAPRQRQQNAQQYLAELEAALGGQTAAPQPSPAPKPGPAPKPAPDPAPQPKPQPAPAGTNAFMAFFKNMTPMKMGIIAVVVLLVIGGWVSSVLEKAEDEEPETSIASNNNGQSNNQNGNQPNNQGNINTGPVFNPPPNQPLQPVQPQAVNPPPDPSNYGVLSGYWIDSKGNRAQISVSLYGELEGQFTGGDLTGYGIAGEFSGTLLQYVIGTDAQGVIGGGVAEWSDICHVIYPDVDMNGAPNGRMVTFHVNHTTDMKCF